MRYKKKVSAEDFIRSWQQARTVGEVAEKTGLTKHQCHARAAYYRSRGVPLRAMTSQKEKWAGLVELARSFSLDPMMAEAIESATLGGAAGETVRVPRGYVRLGRHDYAPPRPGLLQDDAKTTDYCARCGESPDSANHVLPGSRECAKTTRSEREGHCFDEERG